MPQLELFSPVREQEDLSKKKEAKEGRPCEKEHRQKAADIQSAGTELSLDVSQALQADYTSPDNLTNLLEQPASTLAENPANQPGELSTALTKNSTLQAEEPRVASCENLVSQTGEPSDAFPEILTLQPEEPANISSEQPPIHFEQPGNAVVFDDGKISVKIKSKERTPAEVVITPEKETASKEKEKPLKPLNGRGRKSFKEIDATADLVEVPEDEILFQKQYYAISTVAEWFKVNTSLLRFWENEFDILKPRKNRKGDRLFRPEDIKNLQLIYHLLRNRKYTIDGAKEYLKSNKSAADAQLQLTQTLQKFKLFLLELRANL